MAWHFLDVGRDAGIWWETGMPRRDLLDLQTRTLGITSPDPLPRLYASGISSCLDLYNMLFRACDEGHFVID